jgi:RNA polymerase sigma-70 factor (ECF subfamily)
LLARLDRFDEAIGAMSRSLDAALPAPERDHRLRRISRWSDARA